MQERNLESWDDFTKALQELYSDHNERRRDPHAKISSLLFRGHSNSKWLLETTLERAIDEDLRLIDYYRIANVLRPKLETLTSRRWRIPSVQRYEKVIRDPMTELRLKYPAASYLAFLRHHGFPSPLLDWTRSPYIAAFFAFRKPVMDSPHVSIFAYLEWANSHKAGQSGKPAIRGIGSGHAVHRRHFMQQSEYTVCTVTEDSDPYYTSHEAVLARNYEDQDLFWKFNIPASERKTVLGHLSRMNINAFTLFGSDDSLFEDLATTAFTFGWRDFL